jgi:hypothetical protein
MATKQKKAIYNAIINLYRDANRHFEDGILVELSQDERKTVIHIISQGLQNGTIDMTEKAKAKHDTPKKVYNYASSVVNDRLRKDKRLNGNIKHQPDRPGSRAGSQDEIVKGLREYLKKGCFTVEQKANAKIAIEKRLVDIAEEKRQVNLKSIN